MDNINNNYWLYLPLVLWETLWKGIALYKAAQAKDKPWFVAFLLVNSLGILPLIYLIFFNRDNFLAKEKLARRLFPKKASAK